MKSILFVTDNSPHNLIYLTPLADILSASYKVEFKFINNDSVIDVNELNQYHCIITDMAFHSKLIDKSFDSLIPKILSINHSLLGPVNFNTYQSRCLSRLSDHVRSKIKCIYPRFYENFMNDKIINDPSTVIIHGSHRYLLSKYNQVSRISGLWTYFNHWSCDPKTINEIINEFNYTDKFIIRKHPAYSNIENPDSPFITMKNQDPKTSYYISSLMDEYNKYPDLSLYSVIDSSDILIFDGLSGSLMESVVRKCITKINNGFTRIYLKKDNSNSEYSSAHSSNDNKLVESMMIDLGARLLDNKWYVLVIDDDLIDSISKKLDIDGDYINELINLID